MKRAGKFLLIVLISFSGLCLLLAAASAISNLSLPQHSEVVETLSLADKLRLTESLHLRQAVGERVWPGWGQADIPAIVYNESYAFLTGYPEPPAGWIKVPAGIRRGVAWESVPNDTFNNQPYYRQRLPDPSQTPQAFTVMVGDRWVSSMATVDWTRIGLMQPIRQDLPPFLRPIFPYRLLIGQLIGGSDKYISLVAHEAFHAFQGSQAPERLAAAENASIQLESQYPWGDQGLQAAWQVELDLLAQALQSAEQSGTVELSRRFLEQRRTRRASAQLGPGLVAYEQQREWLEGLARYAELEIWRLASVEGYDPLPETSELSDFEGYTGFATRWKQEVDQIGRMAGDEGDGRFYYSGMAQAYLLDRLAPGWKLQAFGDNVWLDDLLAAAIN